MRSVEEYDVVKRRAGRRGARCAGILAGLVLLAGCNNDEVIFKGERIGVREAAELSLAESGALPLEEPAPPAPDAAFRMPPQVTENTWSHPAGGPGHSSAHPALSPRPQLVWSADIGQGNDRKHRIASEPIVAGGRVFTLDSRAQVTATSTNGETLWSRDLTPAGERSNDASGGGVAYAGGRVFVTTGFGEVIALDPASGGEIWRQKLDAPATSSPTVNDGLIYVVTRDNQAWGIDTGNGRVRWRLAGTPSLSGLVGGAGAAVSDQVAILPFSSGELVAALKKGGVRVWGTTIAGQRRGRAYANISDIVADPVISNGVIYTGNQSGRAVAIDIGSGDRIWTAKHGPYGPVRVAGGSVFMVSDKGKLVRLDAATGAEVWARDLPYFRNSRARRAKAVFAHYGPVLAGGNLWVASDNGTLKGYDPATGAERLSLDIPGGAASAMAVAGRTLYVMSERGKLHAFR